MSHPFLRHLAIMFTASTILSGIGDAHAEEVLRVGFQKSSALLTLIRSQGTLKHELARQSIRVSWHEFPSGLPLLEPLSVDNVDLSVDIADIVPVFAQTTGTRLIHFAHEASSPMVRTTLVGEHSPLKSPAELKGRHIAVTKVASSHCLLITALASAKLEFSDIQPAYLTPADGRVAFENGKVDTWATWDPYVADAQRQQRVRVLTDDQDLTSYQHYYFTPSGYAKKHPGVPQQVFAELQYAGRWLKNHPTDAAKMLGPLWGNLDAATVEQANARRSYGIQPVSADGLDKQQHIADAFHTQGLLPKPVGTRAVEVWQPRH